MKRKPHSRGYYKQARQHRKELRLSGQSCYQTPKVYVYTIPGTLFYTAKPRFEGAIRKRLFIAADGDRSNKLLLTETDMMKLWDTFWKKSNEHPNESCASIYDRAVKRLEQIKQDTVNVFHRYQQKKLITPGCGFNYQYSHCFVMCKKNPPSAASHSGVVDSSHDSLSVLAWTFPCLTSEETFKSRSVIL